ncbi:Pre-mRNA-processing factor 39, partial [Eschrichtius robustus]|nr:Pre-mRNA-processing factor 39 [Eschrichtius robustus]
MDEYRNSNNGSTGNSSEVVVDQSTDFSTEIMNVTEMEQSPDGSPNVNTTTEENEIANTVDLPVTETEANFPPEYEKFWKTVESNPQDFTGWIKRPYFHVKPLEKAQLKNWKEYLEFEIENGTHERVVVLFERCVISCALYEEFWIKYAKYMENHSIEGVRHVFSRACTIHLPKKPMVHMLWAAFEEQQ